ncbi:MAG: sugar transferase [Clostridia bacterium]|nr:sugar transferase [Clostridia bacterium]
MYARFIKRLLDLLISLIALPFVLLAVLILAPVIFINDPGPVFYVAPRRGKNGRTFKMIKFRSMYVHSPDLRNADGSTFNGTADPRVTKVGRLLRKTSLDEVPQFLNVLAGHMSLIGPRPTLTGRPYESIPLAERVRFTVRPGITGYAQAFYRNSITQQEKFQYDAYYAEHLTFGMDCRVLWQTVKTVLGQKNIYVAPAAPAAEQQPAGQETEKV